MERLIALEASDGEGGSDDDDDGGSDKNFLEVSVGSGHVTWGKIGDN
jgi:hypothetical protein